MIFCTTGASLFSVFYFFRLMVISEGFMCVTLCFTPIIIILFLYFAFHCVDGVADIANVYDHAR